MDNLTSYLTNRQKFIKKHLIVKPKIIIDAVCFQFDDSEIKKIWRSLLTYWSNTDFAKNLVILDRENTAEKVHGIRYRNIISYNPNNREDDRQMLQFICDEEEADLFISTYFTTALKTTSIILINDLFPEVNKLNFQHPLLQGRIEAINNANHYILTTNSIAKDFQKIYQIKDNDISVIYGGIDENYDLPDTKTVSECKYRYGIHKPYFLLPNLDNRYNIELFLKAFSQLPTKTAFDIVVTNTPKIPLEWRQYTEGSTWHLLNLSDSEMKLVYHGAIALIHFSYHDGFSSHIIEAMACGCPIIAFKNPSVEEIAGEAVIFVDPQDFLSIFNAFCQVQKPIMRQNLIQIGLKQVSQFSWQKAGEIIKAVLLDLIIDVKLSEINYVIFPDWQTEEEVLGEELTLILEKLITTSNHEEITLLIDTTNISEEEANLFIAGVTMNLLWTAEIEIPDNIHLSILPKFNVNQWQKILPQVLAKISMDNENSDTIAQIEGDFLPTISYKYHNYFLAPDWTVKEEILTQELFNTIAQLANQLTENDRVFLLINVDHTELETVNLLMSDIALNLLLEHEIDISKQCYISCIQNLTSQQWQNLSKLITKINLENESFKPIISSYPKVILENPISSLRSQISFRYLSGEGIEIGALHSPLPVSDQAKVKYVDRLSVTGLRKHYPELDKLPLVEVDIIDDGEKLLSIQDSSLDFVIANHMIEHCENPIGTIERHLQVLKPNGILYMAIPDKRYTFDCDRPCTSLEHLIKDYQEGTEWSRKSHFEEWVRLVNKKPEEEVVEHINKLMEINYSIHFHVWTQKEFFELLLYCGNILYFPFEIELIQSNGGEFITILRKINENKNLFNTSYSAESLSINSYPVINLPFKIAQEIWQYNLQPYADNNLTLLQEEYQRINLDLFTTIPPHLNTVLEVGCGCGLYGERYKLINPHCQYIGVESNQEKIINAESRLDQVIHSNFSNFYPNDLGIEAKTIDCLIYNNILEYNFNFQEILTEHLSLLKDDGYVIICVDNQQHWSRIINLFSYAKNNSEIVNKFPNYNLNQLETILKNSGLKIVKIIPSKTILPSQKFIDDSQSILQTLNIKTKEFEDTITHLQYIIVAKKITQESTKSLLIHTRISNTICRLMRVEYPHYCLQTNPYIHLKQEENNDFSSINFDGDKIFIWQRPFLDYPIELDIALEKQKQLIDAGYIIIMELDDDPIIWVEEIREKFHILARLCHGIQTSTKKLAQEMSKIHSQVACFSNQLPYILPYNKNFSDNKITLLFAAQNRQSDWQIIIDTLNQIIDEYGDKLYIKVVYDRGFYEVLKTDQKEFEDWCSYTRYQEILKTCDVHLIPLENNQFNSMKSDLKFIESSAYGVISLASATVYEESIIDGETGLIYHSIEEFKAKLITLINDRILRENISRNAYNYVKNNRLLSQHYQQRVIWYKQMINNLIDSNKIDEYHHKYILNLEEEANRQEELENQSLTYTLREQLRKSDPQNVNNLLKLILLKIEFNILQIDDLKIWNIANLLRENKKNKNNKIDKQLLLLATEKLLDLPFQENIDFADAVYTYFDGDDNINKLFLSKLLTIEEETRYYSYGAKLGEVCLNNETNNLEIVNQLIHFYNSLDELNKVKIILHNLYQSAKNTAEKTVALSKYYSHLITQADWQEAIQIITEFKNILKDLIEQQPEIKDAYLRNGLSKITQPLLYVDDQPREKRLLINGIGQLFQKIAQNHYSCPVHFLSPEQKNISRKLRIGYIGRTMRSHPVGLLGRWLIHHHDREKFAIYTYFVCNQVEDEITQEFFRKNVTKAHNSTNVVNDLITEIEKDEIDILVDLDSFTENMTSMIMALKPAPIQVSWLGLDSNGIPATDYFIVDPYVLPDNAQEYYSEKIWRLSNIYLGVDGFEVGTPNLTRQDLGIPKEAVVYLSLQTGLKRHPDNIRLQMKILARIPNSYFLISGDKSEVAKNNIGKIFTTIALEEGVNPQRIIILPFMPLHSYRANLTLGDIVLDTYPFNGATTTIDALWLNIPLVTRVGEQFHARQGYTLLTNLGIFEGIAWNDEQYIEWGIKLGTDENLRKEISWKLKQSKKTSPLWNGKQFAREMENAYRQMWEIYVKENSY